MAGSTQSKLTRRSLVPRTCRTRRTCRTVVPVALSYLNQVFERLVSSRMRHSTAPGRLLILGVLAALVTACNVQISMQAEARDQWQRRYTLAEGGTLEIRNTNGLIQVEPTSGNEVEITADRIVKAATDEAAKDELAKWDIEQTATPDRIAIDTTKNGINYVLHLNRRSTITSAFRNRPICGWRRRTARLTSMGRT